MKNKKKQTNTFYMVCGIFLFLGVIYRTAVNWVTTNFTISLNQLLYTVVSPLKGADAGFIGEAVKDCLPSVLAFAVFWSVYVFLDKKISSKVLINLTLKLKNKELNFNVFNISKIISVVVVVALFITSSIKAENTLKISEYISSYMQKTTIYEDYYVDPNNVKITAPQKNKNLIYIYLESMETTYATVEEGGYQPSENYIPNLTKLASNNISFSNCEKIGGFRSVTGTTWTMGSLFSTTAGVPFSFPVDGNSMSERTAFASGITVLGDILKQNGYVQKFLCGSDGDFGGRKTYFEQHGNYEVVDLFASRKKGYIPEDYFAWWGHEDKYLYEIAKKELTELSNKDQPFNFTMLTVDTHHVGGYVCDLCERNHDESLADVINCADSQIGEFINWCKEQSFYEDTVIIITGDHPRMDSILIHNRYYLDRTIYNCFINTNKDITNLNFKNREFTAMDIFPTVLSALNFEIEGDKLGLGINLFSNKKTLAEIMGVENLQKEIQKYSKYYIDNFS